MPELPEVETTIQQLKKEVLDRKIEDIWCDNKKMVKRQSYDDFKEELLGKKIKGVRRRAKLILVDLSEKKTLLVHQKISGHLLTGKWKFEDGKLIPREEILKDRVNTYIHFLLTLDNGQMLALSDLRKFGKVELWNTEKLRESDQIKKLGPEPLKKEFTFDKFKQVLKNRRAPIKKTLMNQQVIAGIGNIYSDEILWEAKVNPFKPTDEISDKELKRIFSTIKSVLKNALRLKGTSISDYRDLKGNEGSYEKKLEAYHQHDKKCSRCGITIQRKKIGGRSAHFCPRCQNVKREV